MLESLTGGELVEIVNTGQIIRYTYDPGDSDFDIFLYKANDGLSESNVSTIVYGSANVSRDIPIALDNEVEMQEDEVKTIEFYSYNTQYLTGVTPTIEVSSPTYGSLSALSEVEIIAGVTAKWTATYTPIQDSDQDDQITFSIIDSDDDVSVQDGDVDITINAVNDAPILSN